MKYFNIDETIRHHNMDELRQLKLEGYNKLLNSLDKQMVLNMELQEKGLYSYVYKDGSGFEILPAPETIKKVSISNRAKEYMQRINETSHPAVVPRLEVRKRNIMFNKAGGNAGSGSYTCKISLPSKWINELEISINDREVELSFAPDKKEIVIRKVVHNGY